MSCRETTDVQAFLRKLKNGRHTAVKRLVRDWSDYKITLGMTFALIAS